jgi:multiple sugar transport system substrate-binding protein
MTNIHMPHSVPLAINRRTLLGSAAAGMFGAGLGWRGASAAVGGEDEIAHWTPDYVNSIAGTVEVDTAAECAKVVPLKTKGKLTFWYVGPNQASPPIDKIMYDQFWEAFGKTYPNITVERVSLDYNSILDKLRTAAMGNADAAMEPGTRRKRHAA